VRGTDHEDPDYETPPVPCYIVLLRPKYLAQHPIFEHPQPMFAKFQINKK